MKITKAEFVTSFSSEIKYREYAATCSIPEICVVGRSNVGKSTFVNMLSGRQKLAKTSSTPGRTRLINVFDFNDGEFRLVDLPGYGYAKAAKSQREEWSGLMEGYLLSDKNLKHTFVLVDGRHEPTELDRMMTEYLYYYRMPFTVVATKCDKISAAERGRSVMRISTALKIGRDDIIPVDMNAYGKDKICAKIENVLAYKPEILIE